MKETKKPASAGLFPTHALQSFHDGTLRRAYDYFGCHPAVREEQEGFLFRVWAPHAKSIGVVGDFNLWDYTVASPMHKISDSVWECFIPGVQIYDAYKYYIEKPNGSFVYKSDPYAFHAETRPNTASKVYQLEGYRWNDGKYRSAKARRNYLKQPVHIYELHIGSWMRQDNGEFLSYSRLAEQLIPYVQEMGYTHIALMPIAEYPYDGSWGYQATGFFAPSSRYGTPHAFMHFVDRCHQAGIGVILDWAAAHFPKDEHGLYEFDGGCCYEYEDPLKKEHPNWGTRIFDYGRPEVISFLVSNIAFWQEQYHIDGFRVSSVDSMLYLDYGKQNSQWRPNQNGGNINLEAVALLQNINDTARDHTKNVLTIAEDCSFPSVTKPSQEDGLGFTLQSNTGWKNDMLSYMATDPIYRKGIHRNLTFSLTYAFSEHYLLPLTHDEVVHGKGSMIQKMPGEYEGKFDNLRALYGYMMAHPGKKLQFMGNEFAQFIEWNYTQALDWLLLDYPKHQQMHQYVRDLNRFYLDHPCLWQNDTEWDGFQWISHDDTEQNIIAFRRIDQKKQELIALCNFSPVARTDYRIGVPYAGTYTPVFSSDAAAYGGQDTALEAVVAEEAPLHGYPYSISLTVAPMSVTFYEVKKTAAGKTKASKKANTNQTKE